LDISSIILILVVLVVLIILVVLVILILASATTLGLLILVGVGLRGIRLLLVGSVLLSYLVLHLVD